MATLLPIKKKRVSQPQSVVAIDWSNPVTKGLLAVNLPNYEVISKTSSASRFTSTRVQPLNGSTTLAQSITGNTAGGLFLPSIVLSARTDLFIVSCSLRKTYGSWLRSAILSTSADSFPGEYSDSEVGWIIHGNGWNSSFKIFDGTSPVSLVGNGNHVVVATWNKNKNSGYGKIWVDSKAATRTGGTPSTEDCNRLNSSADTNFGISQNEGGIALYLQWDRDLTDDEVQSISMNPWQIFNPNTFLLNTAPSAVSVFRPGSDVAVSGWSAVPSGALYATMNETVADDNNYARSPDLVTPATMGLDYPMPIGSYNIDVRFKSANAGQVRINLLDAGGSSVGISSWQSSTTSFATYSLSVTTTGIATQFRIEVQ